MRPSQVDNFMVAQIWNDAVNSSNIPGSLQVKVSWDLNDSDENIDHYLIYYGRDDDLRGNFAVQGISPIRYSSATTNTTLSFFGKSDNENWIVNKLTEGLLKIGIQAVNTSGEKSEINIITTDFRTGTTSGYGFGSGGWGNSPWGD